MAMQKVTMISNALTMLGKDPVITLGSNDKMVVAAEQAFDFLIGPILTTNNWRFAVQIAQLSKLVEEAPPPWKHVYLLPASYLSTIRMQPLIYDWDIFENRKIYTNYDGELFMEYVFIPEINTWPDIFCYYFTLEIANYLCLSNAERPDYAARISADRDRALGLASASLLKSRPQFSQATFPVLSQRYVSTIIGGGAS